MAWVERGQATDTWALVGSIEDLSGADLVTDRTIVQAHQGPCAIGLRQSFLQDGAVAVVGLKGENPPTLFQERKQCMAVVRTHVDPDRPLQPALEQFGYAIGLVLITTIRHCERPDCQSDRKSAR